MGGNAYNNESGADQPGSYWHRRAVTLAAGLSLLGLLAWIFSGGGKQAQGNSRLPGCQPPPSQRAGLAIGENRQDSARCDQPGGVVVRGRPGAGRTLPS